MINVYFYKFIILVKIKLIELEILFVKFICNKSLFDNWVKILRIC